ncbi:MAG: hypothetical protein Ct9H300mP11_07450 [Chloroflexota bacterium]|nr:MAG: hypothetical protein Ct9H300mP11_07450 [Chloroflexota bacterium]
MYSPMIGSGATNEYVSQTGLDALKGADILSTAPAKYSSTIEYGGAQILPVVKEYRPSPTADLGARVLYTGLNPGAFDTHANQPVALSKLWGDVSAGIGDFYQDLKEHNAEREVVMLMFSKFWSPGSREGFPGPDHGSGSVAFVIGEPGKGASTENTHH